MARDNLDKAAAVMLPDAAAEPWWPRVTVAVYGSYRVDLERSTTQDAPLYGIFTAADKALARLASLPGEADCAELERRAPRRAAAASVGVSGATKARRIGQPAGARAVELKTQERDIRLKELWQESLDLAPELKTWKRAEFVARDLSVSVSGVLKRAQALGLAERRQRSQPGDASILDGNCCGDLGRGIGPSLGVPDELEDESSADVCTEVSLERGLLDQSS